MRVPRAGRHIAGPFFVDPSSTITFQAPPAFAGRRRSEDQCCAIRSCTSRTSRRSSGSSATTGWRKRFAKRFVAGETLDDALDAVRALNATGITASLDLLGESVTNEREARAGARRVPRDARPHPRGAARRERLGQAHRDGPRHLRGAVRRDHAGHPRRARSEYDSFVRIDMEASAYTRAHARHVRGPALSRRTRRTSASCCRATSTAPSADVEHANALACRVRICKGAYKEPATVAYPGQEGRRRELRAVHARADARRATIPASRRTTSDHRRGEALRDGAGDRDGPVRVPDALRRAARPAGAARARGLPHARLRAVRHAVVSVPHAPPRRASGERRVHHRQRRCAKRCSARR